MATIECDRAYILKVPPKVQAYQIMTGLTQPMWFHIALCQRVIKINKKKKTITYPDRYNNDAEIEVPFGDVLVRDENEYFVHYTMEEFRRDFELAPMGKPSFNSQRLAIAGQANPTVQDADALGRVLVFDVRSGAMVFKKLERLEFGDAWIPAAITLSEVTEARREALKVR